MNFTLNNGSKSLKKYKILAFGDHEMATSGVSTQKRFLLKNLIDTGKYSFLSLGAAIKHENYDTIKLSDDWVIKPIDGFGDPHLIRSILISEKPDAVFLFSDPRFYNHIWNYMEDEIHQICPILYWGLWDNKPSPLFNKYIYSSCDQINCINKLTYNFVSEWFPEKTKYIPHAVPEDLYFKVPDEVKKQSRIQLLGKERADHFILLFVSRNAKRKNPSDVIRSFKLFADEVEQKYGHRKVTLLMHCDPADVEGPDLIQVVNILAVNNDVIFSKDRIGFEQMNLIYNISDCLINLSSAEGYGLPINESKMTETPVIAQKTGGITDQITNEDGFEFGVALPPEVSTLVGTQSIPYIYDDYVSCETASKAILKIFEMSEAERAEIGRLARQDCLRRFNLKDVIRNWDETLEDTIKNWKSRRPNYTIMSI